MASLYSPNIVLCTLYSVNYSLYTVYIVYIIHYIDCTILISNFEILHYEINPINFSDLIRTRSIHSSYIAAPYMAYTVYIIQCLTYISRLYILTVYYI